MRSKELALDKELLEDEKAVLEMMAELQAEAVKQDIIADVYHEEQKAATSTQQGNAGIILPLQQPISSSQDVE